MGTREVANMNLSDFLRASTVTLLAVGALVLSPALSASVMGTATGVSGAPSGPFDPDTPGGTVWTIGSETDPIQIVADPNSPPWEKNLTGVPDLQPGERIEIHEHLLLGPILDPTGSLHKYIDWHEHVPVGWEWIGIGGGAMDPVIEFPGQPGPIPGLEVMVSADGFDIWFHFDPLAPDTQIVIWKELECVAAGGCNTGVLSITEFPTLAPEPGTASVLGAALLGLLLAGGFRARSRVV